MLHVTRKVILGLSTLLESVSVSRLSSVSVRMSESELHQDVSKHRVMTGISV